jgi:hypothetical protein
MIDQPLMDYFKFGQDDLYANQNGQFTEKQKARLIQEDKSDRNTSRILGIILLLIGLGGLAGAIFAVIANSNWGFRIGFGLGFGCVWPLVWGGIGFSLAKDSFSKHQFKLAKVQGIVNIVRRESYSTEHHTTSVYHELHIGGQEFSVEEDLANVLMQGDEYVLYYVEDTSKIMSAELISQVVRRPRS